MTRMKSWESPRRGRRRNDKSKAATARLRQLKKRNKQLRKRLRKNNANKIPSGTGQRGFCCVSIHPSTVNQTTILSLLKPPLSHDAQSKESSRRVA